jgi:hypothetical protein
VLDAAARVISKNRHSHIGCHRSAEVPKMNHNVRAKADVLALMRRLGLDERIGEATLRLPDPVDLVRDSATLADRGLTFDAIIDRLGGSAWLAARGV